MLAIPCNQPSLDTTHTIWCLGDDHTYPLTFIFPPSGTQKMPACWLLHCWLMWATVQSLQRGTSAVHLWSWKVEMILWDCKANAISLKPGDLVLAKADAYKGWRKVKDQWEEEPYKVECRVAKSIPSYLMKTSGLDAHESSTGIDFFSLPLQWGAPLCLGVWA